MTTIALTKADRRHARREKDKDRALEYFKAGMDTVKPIVASKPFLFLGGSLVVYKLVEHKKIDAVTGIAFGTALLTWMSSDLIDAIMPF